VERPTRPQIVNVGSGHGHSINDVIATIEEVAGERLLVERRAQRTFDISEIVLDVSRLRALTPFEPTPLEEGVRRMLESPVAFEFRTAAP